MNNPSAEEARNQALELYTDKAVFHDIESNAGHGEQGFGSAPQRARRRHFGIFGWLPSLDVDFLSRNPRHYVSHSIRPFLLRSAIFLLPSFLQSRIHGHPSFDSTPQGNQKNRDHGGKRPRPLSPTAYLDGMRGVAAFCVFLCHYFYTCFVIAEGWGSGGSNYHFLTLPFVRLFYSGPPMVCIFFVISGYALSLKPLKIIHSVSTYPSSTISSGAYGKKQHEHNNYSQLLETLSSLVFRRGLRLFIPPAISTFLIVLLLRLGVYEWNRSFASDGEFLRNVQEIHYTRFGSATEQFVDWGYAVLNFVHLWDWDAFAGSTGIDVHLWTISVEFRASMVLFLTILGTARLKPGVRMGVVLAWCGFAFLWERWDMCLFWMGMVLAEGDVVREMAAKMQEGRKKGALPANIEGEILPIVEPTAVAMMGDVMLMPQQRPHKSRRHPQSHPGATTQGVSSDMYSVGSEDEASHSSTYPHSSNHLSSTSSRHRSGSAPLLSTTPSIPYPFHESRQPPPSATTALPPSPPGNAILPTILLTISLYLLSQPDINSHLTPGWRTLTSLIPHWWTEYYRFYQSIGAVIFVYAVSRYPSSAPAPAAASPFTMAAPIFSSYLNPKTLFDSSIAQYLGKISYAIYLVHGPVLHTLGYTVMKLTWTWVTGTETDGQYITGFVLASLVVVPVVVWVADVFWRGVDEPVVKFARRVEERVVVVVGG